MKFIVNKPRERCASCDKHHTEKEACSSLSQYYQLMKHNQLTRWELGIKMPETESLGTSLCPSRLDGRILSQDGGMEGESLDNHKNVL